MLHLFPASFLSNPPPPHTAGTHIDEDGFKIGHKPIWWWSSLNTDTRLACLSHYDYYDYDRDYHRACLGFEIKNICVPHHSAGREASQLSSLVVVGRKNNKRQWQCMGMRAERDTTIRMAYSARIAISVSDHRHTHIKLRVYMFFYHLPPVVCALRTHTI